MLKHGTRQDVGLIRQGSYQGASDVQDHYWFDTLEFQAATVSSYSFFTTPISATKVRQKTNLQDPGKFPTGQSFVANAVGFKFLPKFVTTPALASERVEDFYTVMEESTVEIIIAGREFDFQAPASIFLPPITTTQQTTSATDLGVTEQRVGDFNNHGWVVLKTPITISELVSFRLQFDVNNSDTEVAAALGRLVTADIAEFRWVLRGTLERLK